METQSHFGSTVSGRGQSSVPTLTSPKPGEAHFPALRDFAPSVQG